MRTLHPDIVAEVERNRLELQAKSNDTKRISALQAEVNALRAEVNRISSAIDNCEMDAQSADELVEGVRDLVQRALQPLKDDIAELQTKAVASPPRLVRDAKDVRTG